MLSPVLIGSALASGKSVLKLATTDCQTWGKFLSCYRSYPCSSPHYQNLAMQTQYMSRYPPLLHSLTDTTPSSTSTQTAHSPEHALIFFLWRETDILKGYCETLNMFHMQKISKGTLSAVSPSCSPHGTVVSTEKLLLRVLYSSTFWALG